MHMTAKMDAAVFRRESLVVVGKGATTTRRCCAISPSPCPRAPLSHPLSAHRVAARARSSESPVRGNSTGDRGSGPARRPSGGNACGSNCPSPSAICPQFGAFPRDLTVAEILDFAVALRLPSTRAKATRDQWSEHVIDLARIRPFLHQKYRTLSGGQMRRIALAEELIGDPAFLFSTS